MSTPSPLHFRLALALFLAFSAGLTAPAAAAWRDFWPFGREEKNEEPVPDPTPYTVTLNVAGEDKGLSKALTRASNLVESKDTPPSGVAGLIARAREDVARLVAALYENAYYAGQVEITLAGRPLESVGPFDTLGPTPIPVRVDIEPGAPFLFGAITASPLPEGTTLEKLGLVAGEPAGSATVLKAEAGLVDAWRQLGYPLAKAGPRDTIADHATRRLDIALHVEPGPQARFGRVSVNGTEQVSPELVAGRANLGDRLYSPRRTRYAEDRLRDLGVFESVRIAPADALDPDGTIPMTITVSERKRRVIGGTVSYSNTEGVGAGIYWRHRNLFGGAEQLQLSASISRLFEDEFDPDYRVTGKFIKPAVFDPMTDFTLRLEGYRETTEAYRVTSVETEAGLTHFFSDTITGSLGVELARFETVDDKDRESDHLLLTLKSAVNWDMRDNRLDPTRGFLAQVIAEPAYDFLKDTAYATFGGDLAVYYPFGPADRFVLAGRIAGTVITVDDIEDVAASERLYAGGAGSVRGYGYMNIGPRDEDGDLVGGRSRLLLSGEARYRINDSFGVVAFVDAGTVSSDMFPDFGEMKVGAGAGLRYITPVGPIRVDLAVPLDPEKDDPDFAVYVGLGQAF